MRPPGRPPAPLRLARFGTHCMQKPLSRQGHRECACLRHTPRPGHHLIGKRRPSEEPWAGFGEFPDRPQSGHRGRVCIQRSACAIATTSAHAAACPRRPSGGIGDGAVDQCGREDPRQHRSRAPVPNGLRNRRRRQLRRHGTTRELSGLASVADPPCALCPASSPTWRPRHPAPA